jgi:hypothetical protein
MYANPDELLFNIIYFLHGLQAGGMFRRSYWGHIRYMEKNKTVKTWDFKDFGKSWDFKSWDSDLVVDPDVYKGLTAEDEMTQWVSSKFKMNYDAARSYVKIFMTQYEVIVLRYLGHHVALY